MKSELIAPILLLATVASSQTNTDSLRQTLAKIVFAHDVSVINRLAATSLNRETPAELQQALATEKLEFMVTDSSMGAVSDIANRNLVEFVRWLPDNKRLEVEFGIMHVTNGDRLVGDQAEAQVRWGAGGSMSPIPATLTIAEWLQAMSKADQRYASPRVAMPLAPGCTSYINPTIRATHKGETAEWRALYLFGCGKRKILAVDLVMDDAVPKFWNASVYPYTLLNDEGGIRGRTPAVQEWLNAHASSTCTGTHTCYENGTIVIPKEKIPAPQASGNSGLQPSFEYDLTEKCHRQIDIAVGE